jgi:hypothetical protein
VTAAAAGRGAAVTFAENEERFAAVEAKFVRFTIFATNNGFVPCIDELEVFTSGEKSRNVGLASAGADGDGFGDVCGESEASARAFE